MSATQSHVSVDRRHNVEDRRSPANRRQEGGAHYGLGELQHWDVVSLFNLDYFQGNITKYVFRHKDKNAVEDLKKALHYLEKYMEVEYGWTRPAPEPELTVMVDPPSGHNRFLRKAARIGALYTMSAHAFAHAMGVTEAEAEELLNTAKAEGDYVPPEQRRTMARGHEAVCKCGHILYRHAGSDLVCQNLVCECKGYEPVEGDSLCGASLTESGEFAPPIPLKEALEDIERWDIPVNRT